MIGVCSTDRCVCVCVFMSRKCDRSIPASNTFCKKFKQAALVFSFFLFSAWRCLSGCLLRGKHRSLCMCGLNNVSKDGTTENTWMKRTHLVHMRSFSDFLLVTGHCTYSSFEANESQGFSRSERPCYFEDKGTSQCHPACCPLFFSLHLLSHLCSFSSQASAKKGVLQ